MHLLFLATILHLTVGISCSFVIENLSRTIHLLGPKTFVNEELSVTLTNTNVLQKFVYSLNSTLKSHLIHIKAINEDGRDITVEYVEQQSNIAFQTYLIDLEFESNSKYGRKFTVMTIFAGLLSPSPDHVKQGSPAFMSINLNYYSDSSYSVKQQNTVLTCPTNVIDVESSNPFKILNEKVLISNPAVVEPFSRGNFFVRFKADGPFLIITDLERTVRVSHWGKIQVDEYLNVRNIGPKLDGPYSRYQESLKPDLNSAERIHFSLPSGAHSIYYRDGIGNVSTSTVLAHFDSPTELILEPRFPLFGGWSTDFNIGYLLSVSDYVTYQDSNDRNLKKLEFSLTGSQFNNFIAERFTAKFVFPEGAKIVSVNVPIKDFNMTETTMFSNLDLFGRPVLLLTLNLASSEKDLLVQVVYHYPDYQVFLKPSIVTCAIFSFLFILRFLLKMNMTISESKSSLRSEKTLFHFDELIDCLKDMFKIFKKVSDSVSEFKVQKNVDKFDVSLLPLNNTLESQRTRLLAILKKIELVAPELADDMRNVKTLVFEYLLLVSKVSQAAKDVVSDALTREDYVRLSKEHLDDFESYKKKLNALLRPFSSVSI